MNKLCKLSRQVKNNLAIWSQFTTLLYFPDFLSTCFHMMILFYDGDNLKVDQRETIYHWQLKNNLSTLKMSAVKILTIIYFPIYLSAGANIRMWSADLSPKSRRGILRRAVFSEEQRKELERTFRRQKYISKTDRNKLAADLSLKESQVNKHALPKALPNHSLILKGIIQKRYCSPKLISGAWESKG